HWGRQGDACSSAAAPSACPAITEFGFHRVQAPYIYVAYPGDDGGMICFTVDTLLARFPQSPESARRLEEAEGVPTEYWATELVEEAADALEILAEIAPSRLRALVRGPTRGRDAWVVQCLMPRN